MSGVLWLSGAVTLLLTLALPGSTIDSLWAVAVIAAFAVAWGALMLSRLAWAHWPVRLSHISTILSLGVVAALTRVTGGTDSPALDYLWFVVVYAAFFYTPRQAWPTGWPAASCTRCPSSTTGTRSRATSRASSSSSCRSTAWSAASSWRGASCWPAPPAGPASSRPASGG